MLKSDARERAMARADRYAQKMRSARTVDEYGKAVQKYYDTLSYIHNVL